MLEVGVHLLHAAKQAGRAAAQRLEALVDGRGEGLVGGLRLALQPEQRRRVVVLVVAQLDAEPLHLGEVRLQRRLGLAQLVLEARLQVGAPLSRVLRVPHEALAVQQQLDVALLEHVELDAPRARPVRQQPLVELERELLLGGAELLVRSYAQRGGVPLMVAEARVGEGEAQLQRGLLGEAVPDDGRRHLLQVEVARHELLRSLLDALRRRRLGLGLRLRLGLRLGLGRALRRLLALLAGGALRRLRLEPGRLRLRLRRRPGLAAVVHGLLALQQRRLLVADRPGVVPLEHLIRGAARRRELMVVEVVGDLVVLEPGELLLEPQLRLHLLGVDETEGRPQVLLGLRLRLGLGLGLRLLAPALVPALALRRCRRGRRSGGGGSGGRHWRLEGGELRELGEVGIVWAQRVELEQLLTQRLQLAPDEAGVLPSDLHALRLEGAVGVLQLAQQLQRLAQQRLELALVRGAAHPKQGLVEAALEQQVFVLVRRAPRREPLAQLCVERVAVGVVLVEDAPGALEGRGELQRRLV